MVEQDKSEFRDIITMLCVVYDRKNGASQQMLRLYFSALQGYTIEQVQAGVDYHTSHKKYSSFFPKPGDIIRGIEGEDLSPSEEFRQYLRSQGRKVEF